MLNKLKLLWKLRQLNPLQFIRYNFFCKSVKRSPGHWLFPFRHSVIVLSPRSRLILDGNLYLNRNKIGDSKAEAYLALYGDARLHIRGDVKIRFGSTIQINDGASARFGRFTGNANINIQCNQRIEIGDDCMIGRNVIIYDSEFHPTGSSAQTMRVRQAPTRIGNHVWIQTNAVITRGSQIGDNCIIGLNAFISGRVRDGAFVVPSVSRAMIPAPLWGRTLDGLPLRERPPVAVPHGTDAPDEAIAEKIRGILQKEMSGIDFSRETSLVDDGILDSPRLLTVVALLEDAFSRKIPFDFINASNFNSVDRIAAMMSGLISDAPARREASGKPPALDSMEQKILSLLRNECPDVDFDTDAELVSDGILDSLSITTIIAALTLEFGVIIPYEDITEENFNSVKAMAAMMKRLKK